MLGGMLWLAPPFRFRITPTFMFGWEDSQQTFVLMYPEGIVKLNLTEGINDLGATIKARLQYRYRDLSGALSMIGR